jgi:hypothetical protein
MCKLFDAARRCPLRLKMQTKMNLPHSDSGADRLHPQAPPPFPQLWIGYLFVLAVVAAEIVATELHPEMVNGERITPPLYLFLVLFLGVVYWLVCIHRLHVVMQHVPGWKHPISPARAVGFHFVPIYYLYWIFKWPREIARFVNLRLRHPAMRFQVPGVITLMAFLIGLFFDRGLGLFLLFFSVSYVSVWLRRALSLPPGLDGAAPSA